MLEIATNTLTRLALLAVLCASPAFAASIPSEDAVRHLGKTATVSGRAALTIMPSGEAYIDLDGRGEGAPVAGYVSRWNRGRFSDLSAIDGKMIEITGHIEDFRDQPQIFLQDPAQIRVK
ncbi:MAG TPA: hypothetical protein VH189_14350 [Rhizomicrobium sp.]|jgi:hypothetical protein|nr:hypothetical protein [Rhizomicrobium sp.]